MPCPLPWHWRPPTSGGWAPRTTALTYVRGATYVSQRRFSIDAAAGAPRRGGFQVRNCLAHNPAFLDLIAHERILPLVVDCIGPNLQIRTSHLDYRPPYPAHLAAEMGATPFGDDGTENGADAEAGYRNVGFHPDLASPGLFLAPSLDGILPLLEIKVFIPLMDMTESGCGNLWLVPVSARPTSPPKPCTEGQLTRCVLGRARTGRRLRSCASGASESRTPTSCAYPPARPSSGGRRSGTASGPTSRSRTGSSCTWAVRRCSSHPPPPPTHSSDAAPVC